MSYNPKIHNRRSMRLKGYDYSQNGLYFITICTKNQGCVFGEINDGKMFLNRLGKIAQEFWQKIETLHDFVKLGFFVVMPNHLHGIIFIDNIDIVGVCSDVGDVVVGACQWHAPTGNGITTINDIQLPSKGIPSLVNHYKGAVKKWANKNQNESFLWQRNYYEHIIKNEKAFEKIQEYVVCNPLKWEKDCFFNR